MKYEDLPEYDFAVIRGVDVVHSLFDWDMDGEPMSLEEADEVRVDFRAIPSLNGAPDLSLTVDNGGLVIEGNSVDMVFGENTLKLSAGIYYYDVLVVLNGIRETYVRGKMTVGGVITR